MHECDWHQPAFTIRAALKYCRVAFAPPASVTALPAAAALAGAYVMRPGRQGEAWISSREYQSRCRRLQIVAQNLPLLCIENRRQPRTDRGQTRNTQRTTKI